jgi:hypothetical protein
MTIIKHTSHTQLYCTYPNLRNDDKEGSHQLSQKFSAHAKRMAASKFIIQEQRSTTRKLPYFLTTDNVSQPIGKVWQSFWHSSNNKKTINLQSYSQSCWQTIDGTKYYSSKQRYKITVFQTHNKSYIKQKTNMI